MSISTQISSYLVPRPIWEGCYQGTPSLALPARDALDIERRWRKGVILHSEAKRFAICCKRLQGLVRELEIKGAPIAHVHRWGAYQNTEDGGPRAVAYLAAMEYLRRFYQPDRAGEKSLKYDRLEAIFHPPGERLSAHLQLLTKAQSESKLHEMCAYAVRKADVLAGGWDVSPGECEGAIRKRHEFVSIGVEQDCGLVDVLDLA